MELNVQLLVITFLFLMTHSYTECENKYIGWWRFNQSYFSEKQKVTICDKRFRGGSIYKKVKKKYSQIDCYIDEATNELYTCRFYNLYGTFLEYANIFRYTAYCVIAKETKKYLTSGVDINIGENINNLNQLFKLLMIEIDQKGPPPMYSKSYINIPNQNVWVYDNIDAISRCMSYIPNLPEYKPNTLHCLGALSILFEYKYLLHERGEQLNYIAIRYTKDMFSDKDEILVPLIMSYFNEILTVENVIEYSDGEEIYIKELRFNAKNWIKHSLFVNDRLYKRCVDDITQRSPVLMDMANEAKMYWNNKITNYMKNNWLYLISENKKMNGFEIYTKYRCDMDGFEYFNSLNMKRNIVFVANNYDVNNKCLMDRCIDKMETFVDDLIMGLLFDKNDVGIDIIIVGNPYLLSFELKYLLFKNINVLIGIYNPIFSMSALFMKENSIVFEIVLDNQLNTRHIFAMRNVKYYNMNELVDINMISNVDMDNFVAKFK